MLTYIHYFNSHLPILEMSSIWLTLRTYRRLRRSLEIRRHQVDITRLERGGLVNTAHQPIAVPPLLQGKYSHSRQSVQLQAWCIVRTGSALHSCQYDQYVAACWLICLTYLCLLSINTCKYETEPYLQLIGRFTLLKQWILRTGLSVSCFLFYTL